MTEVLPLDNVPMVEVQDDASVREFNIILKLCNKLGYIAITGTGRKGVFFFVQHFPIDISM